MNRIPASVLRRRRTVIIGLLSLLLLLIGTSPGSISKQKSVDDPQSAVLSDSINTEQAVDALDELEVKGRASKAGYARDEFGSGWASIDGCDTRNIILKDMMSEVVLSDDSCIVLRGTLQDLYTGEVIDFVRGSTTSDKVQIDHVVALSDSWQKGAQQLDFSERVVLANDPLNLLAVDGPANQQKGDSDAASWLPPNKAYRCRYVARQISVKRKYRLWITDAEKSAMKRVLNGCGEQVLPVET